MIERIAISVQIKDTLECRVNRQIFRSTLIKSETKLQASFKRTLVMNNLSFLFAATTLNEESLKLLDGLLLANLTNVWLSKLS